MSVRFSADTIVASTSNGYSSQSGQVYVRGNVVDSSNSMSSNIGETQALMNNCQQDHQGRHMEPRTPDVNCNASSMSSDYNNINNNNNLHEYNNKATSQAAPLYTNTQASAQHLFIQFHEALALEPKYQPSLFLPQQSNVSLSVNVKVA